MPIGSPLGDYGLLFTDCELNNRNVLPGFAIFKTPPTAPFVTTTPYSRYSQIAKPWRPPVLPLRSPCPAPPFCLTHGAESRNNSQFACNRYGDKWAAVIAG